MLYAKSNHFSFKSLLAALLIGTLVLLSGCSDPVQIKPVVKAPHPSEVIKFTQSDHSKIRRYTIQHRSRLPAKPFSKRYKGEYHYKRNDRLPQFYPRLPLPPHLERKLSQLPQGYTRIQIGDDYGIINIDSRVIYDMIYNADPDA
ncbi:MAG: hypothetical protein ISEC1_P0308 [Thiomicrorhabdus sp.]|nr:MAG: hypothetical protein ISEC1_P0308 [Thiomicrorhabdus sp.]